MSSAQGKQDVRSSTSAGGQSVMTKQCRFFAQGYCRAGDGCRFVHAAVAAAGSQTQESVAGASQRPEGVRGRPPIANGPKAPTVDGAQGTKGKRNRRRKNKGVAMSPEKGPRATEPGSRGVTSVGASQPRDKIQNSGQHVDQTLVTGPPLRAILGNKKPCFAWRDGNCPRGDRCRYSHDPKIRDATSLEQKALREAEEREKRERLLTEERERREAEQRERERIEREERERQARERQEAERKERERIERIAREEQARRERERQEAIERKKREEAEARERRRIELLAI